VPRWSLVCLGQHHANETKSMRMVSFLVIEWKKNSATVLSLCPNEVLKSIITVCMKCCYKLIVSIFHDSCKKYKSKFTLISIFHDSWQRTFFKIGANFFVTQGNSDFPKWAKEKKKTDTATDNIDFKQENHS
jgi:hypothetical protein